MGLVVSNIVRFIRAFGIWFKLIIAELANNLISVLLVLLLYFMLWHFPQTLDLLLVLNQNDATNVLQAFTLEVPLYFALLLIIAFFIWNAPKYYYRENYTKVKFKNVIGFVPTNHYELIEKSNRYSYNCKHHIRKVMPRVLACIVLFTSAFAILNAMEHFGIKNELTAVLNPFNSLVLVVVMFLILLEYHVYCFISKWVRKIPKMNYIIFGTLILLFALIIALGAANNQASEDLSLLFISNIALASMFFIISFNTKDILSMRYKPIFYGGIIVSGLLVLIIYIIFNMYPESTRRLNPLSVLLICLTALYTISFLLVFGGKKMRFPLFTMVFLIAIISGEFNANKEKFTHYTLEEVKSTHKRPTLRYYVHQWIASRKDKIAKAEDHSYPIVFISSEGGGSRAGLWAFLVHSYLEEQSGNTYYEDHLFSLTGASGGSVGNAMFLATAQSAKNNNQKIRYSNGKGKEHHHLKYKASAIYAKNYLSSSIIGLLGRDLFKNVTGLFSFDNRGKLLQQEWQRAHQEAFEMGEILEEDILSYYKKSVFVPPLLMMNSSHAQSGKYSVISPVDYSDVNAFFGYYDFIETLRETKGKDRSVKLVEAMRINAAFPYITPTGEVKQMGQFGDAGYYDNIGGTVTIGLMDVFQEVLETTPEFEDIRDKIAMKSVLIYSDLDETKEVTSISQLGAPLQTLLNVRSGHTKEMIAKLDMVSIGLKRTQILPSTQTKTSFQKTLRSFKGQESDSIKPVLPLGRYLSNTAIYAMEKWLEEDEVKTKLDDLLRYDQIKEEIIIEEKE